MTVLNTLTELAKMSGTSIKEGLDLMNKAQEKIEEGCLTWEYFENGVKYHYYVLLAFLNGAEVEFYASEEGEWMSLSNPSFYEGLGYRVKVEVDAPQLAIWNYLPDDAKYLTKDHADEYAEDEWYWHTELPYHPPVGDGSGDWYWMSDGCMQCLRNVKIPELDALGIDFVERPE